jgi:hypothetical protein
VERLWPLSHKPALTPATLNPMSAIAALLINTAKPVIKAAAMSQSRAVMRDLCGLRRMT